MPMIRPKAAWLAWAWLAFNAAVPLFDSVSAFPRAVSADSLVVWANQVASNGFSVMFVFVGALIVSRQPRNLIGWLLLAPSLSDIFSLSATYYLQYALGVLTFPNFF